MESGGLPLISHLLQHTLRSLCADSQWVYSIFWRVLPRNFPPPKWDTQAGPFDRSKANKRNWILVWEDGFCDFAACCRDGTMENRQAKDLGEEDTLILTLQPELFFKMSHDVYNFGEGIMGKIAADNSHKWVYRNPSEHEIASLSLWQGSLDAHPRTWEAQFCAGIQTIAVVAVGEGLLQLGSTKKISEDLSFVLSLQRRFQCLRSIPGVFAPHPTSEFLQATKIFPTVEKWENASKEEDGSRPFTGDRMPVKADYVTDGNRLGYTKFRGGQLPLPSDSTLTDLLCEGECRAQFSTLQALKPSNRRLDCPLGFEEQAFCYSKPPPVLPSISSLQALLSKLPAVKASDSPRIPHMLDNSRVLKDRSLLGRYINTSILPISSTAAQRTLPQSLSPAAAEATQSISQLLHQSRAVRDSPNCTTTGAGNCMFGEQRSTGVFSRSMAADYWSYPESDASQNGMLEAENLGHFPEFDETQAGDGYNFMDFTNSQLDFTNSQLIPMKNCH